MDRDGKIKIWTVAAAIARDTYITDNGLELPLNFKYTEGLE